VSSRLSPRWARNVATPTVEQTKNMYCDTSPRVTQYFCQQFRLQADSESDLRIACTVVDGKYNEDVAPTPSTFIDVTEGWKFPTTACKRLCCATYPRLE
jgi:hypothetical protein